METRSLGGLTVSVVGLGCNNFGGRMDQEATTAVVNACLDQGITFFDTADIYGGTKSEVFLGKALGARRPDVVVATKFGAPRGPGSGGASPEYVHKACEASLERLGTDYIDLYQLHFPDPNTPIEETLGAMNELVQAGKVREIGCSNFTPEMLDQATQASRDRGTARFVTVQNQLNLLQRRGEEELIEACRRDDMQILPYFPLASGMLTGKYRRDEEPPAGTRLGGMPAERRERALNERAFGIVEKLEAYATEHGHTLLELAISWLATMPQLVSVIAGATKPEQVASNAAAASWKMTDQERSEVSDLAR